MSDRLAAAVATVSAFARAAESPRVVVLLDLGEQAEPAMIECVPDEPPLLTQGEDVRRVTPDPSIAAATLPPLRPPPASSLRADPDSGELAAPIGAIAHLADSVLAFAGTFGGRSVATVEWSTADPELPLTIAARVGDPVLLAIGGRHFELPA